MENLRCLEGLSPEEVDLIVRDELNSVEVRTMRVAPSGAANSTDSLAVIGIQQFPSGTDVVYWREPNDWVVRSTKTFPVPQIYGFNELVRDFLESGGMRAGLAKGSSVEWRTNSLSVLKIFAVTLRFWFGSKPDFRERKDVATSDELRARGTFAHTPYT